MTVFFNRVFPITLGCLIFLLSANAQLMVSSKKEIEINASESNPLIVSTGNNGIVLLTEGKERSPASKKNIYLRFFDNRLAEKANLTFSVPFKESLVQHFSTDNYLVLVYNSLAKEEIHAFKIDLRNIETKQGTFYTLPQVRYYESVLLGEKFILAGVKGKKGILVQLDFDEGNAKLKHIIEGSTPAFVQHMQIFNDKLYTSVKSSDSRDHNLYYQVLNNSNNAIDRGVVEAPKHMKILEGKFAKGDKGGISILGTYANKKSVHPLGIFQSDLGKSATFYHFSDIAKLGSLRLADKKQKAKRETTHYFKLNEIGLYKGKWMVLLEAYDIVQDGKINNKVESLLRPNDNFLKMWPVNNMNYHDYNIHIFQKRMEEVAAYEFKGTYLFNLERDNVGVVDLEMDAGITHKSFGNLSSKINKNGELNVVNKYNGDFRRLNLEGGHLFHYKKLVDRDGNHFNIKIGNAYFWKDNQYLFTTITNSNKDTKRITFYKIRG